jgi:hypothetical protein
MYCWEELLNRLNDKKVDFMKMTNDELFRCDIICCYQKSTIEVENSSHDKQLFLKLENAIDNTIINDIILKINNEIKKKKKIRFNS